jgi:hypothetical protein
MKNYFKREARVMWVLAVIPIVGAFVAMIFLRLKSWR